MLNFNNLALYKALFTFFISSKSAMYLEKAFNVYIFKTNLLLLLEIKELVNKQANNIKYNSSFRVLV